VTVRYALVLHTDEPHPRLAGAKMDFAFESTLSGLRYARHLQRWRKQGYRIEIVSSTEVSPACAAPDRDSGAPGRA
jgi:hypothetical protein